MMFTKHPQPVLETEESIESTDTKVLADKVLPIIHYWIGLRAPNPVHINTL